MSENAPTIDGDKTNSNEFSHTRVFVWLSLIVLIGAALSATLMPFRFTVGVIVGGLGSVLNYFWLKWSFGSMFAKAVLGEKRRFLAARFVLRYVFLASLLLITYYSEAVPVPAVLLGLVSFAMAIFAEGIYTSIVRVKD